MPSKKNVPVDYTQPIVVIDRGVECEAYVANLPWNPGSRNAEFRVIWVRSANERAATNWFRVSNGKRYGEAKLKNAVRVMNITYPDLSSIGLVN